MFSLIGQVFIVLLSFNESLATKCLFLNDEPCMVRPNPVELKYHPFKISLDKCRGSCNVLSPKIYVLKETNDTNFKRFNMLTNKNEAKPMTKHISCDCKYKFNSTACNSSQKWNERCQCKCKNYNKCKKDYSWNPSTCICENSKYLKIIADTSVIECDEIISVTDIVSTKKRDTIATNVSIYCNSRKIRGCFILDTVLLAIILLLIITIICYYYAKQKGINAQINIKWKIMNFKKFVLKIVRVIISMS